MVSYWKSKVSYWKTKDSFENQRFPVSNQRIPSEASLAIWAQVYWFVVSPHHTLIREMAPERPSLSRWNPTRRDALDIILKFIVDKQAKQCTRTKINKKVIQHGLTHKHVILWEKAYVHRVLHNRFYESFFNEYDSYECPKGRKEKDRYIWRCLRIASRVTLEEYNLMVCS